MKAFFIDICFLQTMTIKTGITLILTLLVGILHASKVDSLQQLLSETHDVERKIEIQTQLAKQYQVIDIDQSREIAEKALFLSQTTNTTHYLGEIYGLFGDIAVIQDSLTRAKYYYEISLTNFKESNDIKGVVGVALVLGNIASVRGDLSTALQYYLISADNAIKGNLSNRLPVIYLNIGDIYHNSDALKEALQYYTQALDGILEMGSLQLKGDAYGKLGILYMDLDELETAKDYINKAIDTYTEIEAPVRIAKSLQDLARVFEKEGNFNLAIEKFKEAEVLLEKGNPNFVGPLQVLWAINFTDLGINYLKTNNYSEAHKYLQQGYQLSIKTGQLNISKKATDYLSKYWDIKGNTDSSYMYFRLFKNYTDSLNNEDNIRKLEFQKARAKYEQDLLIEKQAREKQAEKSRRNIILLVVAIVFLLLGLVIVSLFLKLSRNKTKQAELEQENLRHELDMRNKELTTHLMYQVKNNEFILNISNKLKDLYKTSKPENKSLLNEVIREMELDSSTDQWEEFEVRFQQVHTDYYKNLGKKFPDLSSNELRLCAFLRLNMNTKDIAAITYQSTNSITVARWRLRQKFGLNKEESLAAFLTQF